MKILICEGNVKTAKSYPHWERLLELLKDHEIKKIEGILKEQEIIALVEECDVWISIDSMLQHLVAYHKLKRGIVIWGKSSPKVFGYESNINLLKDYRYLSNNQFGLWWPTEPHDPDVFVGPEIIVAAIKKLL